MQIIWTQILAALPENCYEVCSAFPLWDYQQ